MPEQLHLLIIQHRHGQDVSLYRSEEQAKSAVKDYVDQSWESDGPPRWSDSDSEQAMPEDRDGAIAAYFKAAGDESWSIQPISVEPDNPPEAPGPDAGRECELTYMIVVNVHPEDGEPDGDLPAGAPVEFSKLPDDVAESLKDLGNEYLHEVRGVEPVAIRFLS